MNKKPYLAIIDNYDSFTYNLVCEFEKLGAMVQVFKKAKPTHIVLSPGPGHPKDVPLFQQILEQCRKNIPILGVCLGHQAIALHSGAQVVRNSISMHGKMSYVKHDNIGIFAGLTNPFIACRYHSLCVERCTLTRDLQITALSDDNTIMGIANIDYPNVVGVQFHPESLFTEHGSVLLANFLKMKV
jgi:anthranilate synthase/aminodeoxychorismate synthase-like glutamine amidotransferase